MADIDHRYVTEWIFGLALTRQTGSQLYLLTQGSAGSNKEDASISGPEMIPRLS